jgi:sarcosine oxidase gamma subunit
VCIGAHYFQISIHGKLAKPVLSGGVAASISITAFPVIYLVLKE